MTDETRQKIKLANIATKEKRKHQRCFTYKCKIDQSKLSALQREQLKMLFVEAKWVRNDCLARSRENRNENVFKYNPSKIVHVKDKDGNIVERELKYISCQIKHDVINSLKMDIISLSGSKKKGLDIGIIKFKKEIKCIELAQLNHTHTIRSKNKIHIQRIHGNLHVNGMDQFYNDPDIEYANMKLLNTCDGYYVLVTVFKDKDKIQKEEKIDDVIGVDFGCYTSFTLSTGEKLNVTIGETEKLKRLSRKLHRQKKGSNNSQKTLKQYKHEYQKIVNRKNNESNLIVNKLQKYSHVVIQWEQIKGWMKHNGKKVQRSVLGRVRDKLMKLDNVSVLSKYTPTTKFCRLCGTYVEGMKNTDRIFICPFCGCEEDRDIHVAKNMIWLYENKIGFYKSDVDMQHIELTREEMKTIIYDTIHCNRNIEETRS